VNIFLRLKNEVLSNRAGNAENAAKLEKFLPLWCSLPFEQLYFNYAGEAILCCSDVLWEVVGGDINVNSIEEILYGRQFLRVREALLEGRRDKVTLCARCDFMGISHSPKAFLNTIVSVLGPKDLKTRNF
jgi:hypothetical protein